MVGGGVGVDVEDADLALLGEVVLLQGVPQTQGLVRGVGEERSVTVVGGVVALDEVADVNVLGPRSGDEASQASLPLAVVADVVTSVVIRALLMWVTGEPPGCDRPYEARRHIGAPSISD